MLDTQEAGKKKGQGVLFEFHSLRVDQDIGPENIDQNQGRIERTGKENEVEIDQAGKL